MKTRIIYQKDNFRIVEVPDEVSTFADLCGDSFSPKDNPSIEPEILKRDEQKFTRKVENEGIFGYILERWNPEIGEGWEDVSSFFGFVGAYQEGAESYEHYIIKELINESRIK